MAQIIKLVEDAQSSKAPIAHMADIVSGHFVPVVVAIAVLAFAGWLIAGKTLVFALTIFISVLDQVFMISPMQEDYHEQYAKENTDCG